MGNFKEVGKGATPAKAIVVGVHAKEMPARCGIRKKIQDMYGKQISKQNPSR